MQRTWHFERFSLILNDLVIDMARRPDISKQAFRSWSECIQLDEDALKQELRSRNIWTEEQLKDHKMNLCRIVWIASLLIHYDGKVTDNYFQSFGHRLV